MAGVWPCGHERKTGTTRCWKCENHPVETESFDAVLETHYGGAASRIVVLGASDAEALVRETVSELCHASAPWASTVKVTTLADTGTRTCDALLLIVTPKASNNGPMVNLAKSHAKQIILLLQPGVVVSGKLAAEVGAAARSSSGGLLKCVLRHLKQERARRRKNEARAESQRGNDPTSGSTVHGVAHSRRLDARPTSLNDGGRLRGNDPDSASPKSVGMTHLRGEGSPLQRETPKDPVVRSGRTKSPKHPEVKPSGLRGGGVVCAAGKRRSVLQRLQRLLHLGARTEEVDCTVFAPRHVGAGWSLTIQVFVHKPDRADHAEALALKFDPEAQARGFTSLREEVAHGTELTFALEMLDSRTPIKRESLIWQGRTASVDFPLRIPETFGLDAIRGKFTILRGEAPLGHIYVRIPVRANQRPAMNTATGTAHRYHRAFVSYASADRKEVLHRVQAWRRVGIEVFQDVLSLNSGDRWEKELYREIDRADVFFLFWSKAAEESKWVLREIDYAVNRKGGDEDAPPEIMPIPLELPIAKPPESLAHLHFNDPILPAIHSP